MPFVSQEYSKRVDQPTIDKLNIGYLPLGKHPDTGDMFLLPDKDRFSGTYLSGVSGVGKSRFMANLIVKDAELGNAVIVIDPHKDLVMHCLSLLPIHLLPKVFLLNMEDEAHPFGVNVFGQLKHRSSIEQAWAVDRVMHIFETVWPDVLRQQNLPRYLRAATIVLLANPDSTLVDMHRFLVDDKVRASMLKHVTDPTVVDFWQTQYEELSYADRTKRVQPLLGRLELLFMGRSIVRNIVGQRQTTIGFRKAIENKELLFILLPTKSLAQDARLIGTMLMTQIHAAVFSFADVPAGKRPGVSLFIDEFQNFVTPDIAELFTEGRKFGVKLTVAHQFRHQLEEYLRDATMTARTKICFQQTPDDAREMAPLFQTDYAEVREDDIDPHPIKYLLTYGADDYHVRLFIDRFLRPLQSMRHGGKIEVVPKSSWLSTVAGREVPTYEVDDPTLYLDHLLYEVMVTSNPNVHIPFEIVYGFSNCGHSFYHEFRHTIDRGWWLGPQISFPPALAVRMPDESLKWLRRPENGKEELYHFIFCLRATMRYLAEHPLGNATTPGTTELAAMLSKLPHRAAWIRCGDDIGVVYTNSSAKPVSGAEFAHRLQTIEAQTREKYCTPKAEVEASFLRTTATTKQENADAVDTHASSTETMLPETPIRRWEEL